MKKLMTNNQFIVILSMFMTCSGFIIGYITKDFYWLSRFGALIIGLGIILVLRTAFTGQDLLINITAVDVPTNINSSKYYEKIGQPVPDYVLTDKKARKAINVLGSIISFVGTAILGFVDLLNGLFHFCN